MPYQLNQIVSGRVSSLEWGYLKIIIIIMIIILIIAIIIIILIIIIQIIFDYLRGCVTLNVVFVIKWKHWCIIDKRANKQKCEYQ